MSETQDLIARLWARFRPLAVERVGLIAAYLDGPGPRGDDVAGAPDHARARQAAHDLVGSLGSYGHPRGSVLAARLELLLGDGPGGMDAAALAEARAVVVELGVEVER